MYGLEAETWDQSALSVVVVGASGDLARKKIFPALFALYYDGHLPKARAGRRRGRGRGRRGERVRGPRTRPLPRVGPAGLERLPWGECAHLLRGCPGSPAKALAARTSFKSGRQSTERQWHGTGAAARRSKAQSGWQ